MFKFISRWLNPSKNEGTKVEAPLSLSVMQDKGSGPYEAHIIECGNIISTSYSPRIKCKTLEEAANSARKHLLESKAKGNTFHGVKLLRVKIFKEGLCPTCNHSVWNRVATYVATFTENTVCLTDEIKESVSSTDLSTRGLLNTNVPGPHVLINYKNHRGEVADRIIRPPFAIVFDSNQWHPEPQWLLKAWDVEKNAERSFAMKDIRSWDQSEINLNVQ